MPYLTLCDYCSFDFNMIKIIFKEKTYSQKTYSKIDAIMNKQYLDKIDWPQLLKALAEFAQTQEAQTQLLNLRLGLSTQEIKESWNWITSLIRLISLGHKATFADLEPVEAELKAVKIGSILEGEELLKVALVLRSTQQTLEFIRQSPDKNSILWTLENKLKSCTDLEKNFDKCLDEKGEIKENASKELKRILLKRSALAQKIQSSLQNSINHNSQIRKYLQDDYYTLRLGRFVLPMRVDVKGRVPGHIIDSSVSSQTLL